MTDHQQRAPLGKSPAVLIVEDDPTQRMLYAAVASRTGMPVLDAADAPEAVAILQERGPDGIAVVVLDVDLGASTGWDVLTAARVHADRATLPVILLTGHDEVEQRIQGLRAGATDYVGKPADPRELLARIEAHVRTGVSWRAVLDGDLRRRALLADAISQTANEEGAGIRPAVIAALTSVGGVADADVIPLSHNPRRTSPAVPSSRTLLCGLPHEEVVSRVGAGPCLINADDAVVACVPFRAGDGHAVVMLQLDPHSSLGDQALLALAIDAAAMIGPAIGQRLLGDEESAQLRQLIDETIRTHDFRAVYQPVVDVNSKRVVGFEGLTRFTDRRPDVMFADAALVGRSGALHRATIQGLVRNARWLPPDCYLALNISADVLLDPALPSWLPTDRDVVLEVTEHEAIIDYERVVDVAADLGSRVRIAVDDAGAGHATFTHVLQLRPDIVKLDRSLIAGIHDHPAQEALVAGLVHFAHQLGIHLIAEGVEHEEESQLLAELGILYVQGYLFGRPAPAPEDGPAASQFGIGQRWGRQPA